VTRTIQDFPFYNASGSNTFLRKGKKNAKCTLIAYALIFV